MNHFPGEKPLSDAPALRVCHVVASLNPRMGGLPKTAMALACAQAEGGAETAVLYYGTEKGETEVVEAYGRFPGFERVCRLRVPRACWEPLTTVRAMRALSEFEPDVIHTHGLWEPLLRRAHGLAERKGIPFVILPHSMLHPWQMKHKRVPKWILKNMLGWRNAWRNASFVQVLSEEEGAHWRAIGVERTVRVPNGVFPGEDPGDGPLEIEGWNGEPFVLFLSRLHEQKAPEVLLAAFASLAQEIPGCTLIFAGPDYGMRSTLTHRIRAMGLEDRVLMAGVLKGRRKWAALHQTACYCLLSRAEGFSLSLLEAALAGAPCLISDKCYFPELVEAGGAEVSEVDAAEVREKLRALLLDPDRAEGMGRKARDFVTRDYTWDEMARRLMDAYRDVGAGR